ncbi:MAG: alpha/beta fold hydrolase [Micromonosporaceae bacterium]|nr:alpha/beta fold hydrolase [Micromonosporaceae bacterium]
MRMRRIVGVVAAAATVVAGAALALHQTGMAQAATGHTPVVFVHGYTGSASNWVTAQSVFRSAGYSSSELYAYEYNSYGDNVQNARGLSAFVQNVLRTTGASKVDIVNHSMGGLVSLWYIRQLGGTSYVRRLASLAGANHGTTAAGTCLGFETCRQMYPGSAFILTLSAGDETPAPTTYATWYSPCDGVIIPHTSTRLSGATNNYVACENHLTYLTDLGILSQVRTFLR